MSQIPAWLPGAIAGGVLMGLATPPAMVPITCVPGVYLLLRSLRRLEPHQNPALPVFTALGIAWGGAFGWVATHVLPSVALVSVVALVALISVAGVAGVLGYRMGGPAGSAAGLAAIDLVYHFGPIPIPWISWGFSVSDTALDVLPPLVGVAGTAVTLLLLASLLDLATRAMKTMAVDVGVAGGAMAVALVFSVSAPADVPVPAGWRVAIVQPGDAPEAWADVNDAGRSARLSRMSHSVPHADLYVWPETALPVRSAATVGYLSGHHLVPEGSALITGGIVEDTDGAYNAAVYLPVEGAARWSGKRRLVPFAESVPGQSVLPFLGVLGVDAGGYSGYLPGEGSISEVVRSRRFSTLVCFESAFAHDARRGVQDGASVLIVLSQDGWWTSDRSRTQHRALTALVARSVGAPVVIASVSGWSGVIDGRGHMVLGLEAGRPDVALVDVPDPAPPTWYLHVGDWPAWGIFGLHLVVVLLLSRRRDPPFRALHSGLR